MEVGSVRRMVLVAALCTAALITWSCVEEIQPKNNSKPKIWFTSAPRERRVNYQNAATFLWVSTDVDDDLGLGETFVRLAVPVHTADGTVLEPPPCASGPGGQVCVDPPAIRSGDWVRVYQNTYDVGSMPDSVYLFSVRVRDGRGAETTLNREFTVRFDDQPPVIDSVFCPPGKPSSPDFIHTYVIYAHDVAKNPDAATPVDSLTYWFRWSPAPGADGYEPADFAISNRTYQAEVQGQLHPGIYTFRAKVMDLAGNVTPEYKCQFEIQGGGPK
jgi:hypothetical protein